MLHKLQRRIVNQTLHIHAHVHTHARTHSVSGPNLEGYVFVRALESVSGIPVDPE